MTTFSIPYAVLKAARLFISKDDTRYAMTGVRVHVESSHIGITRASNERIVNLAGGHGFHGDAPRVMRRVGKLRAGRLLDGRQHNGCPDASSVPSVSSVVQTK